ncbi:MAG: carbamoyl phosphate synthase small subunit [Clostridiales bacterium]|jgi:carbamoyl-phosphate synthase small subunit|nr:carbamoyl phosphate synthase small subunit [Clostridiales bacterium]
MRKGYLVLENGKVFEGDFLGKPGDVIAEIVFTTAMTGYLETLTDKSYYGQMIVQSFPLIGNYGVIPEDFEGAKIAASAYIARSFTLAPSNFRSTGNIDGFFEASDIRAFQGIDTRALVKIIRERGVMNAMLTEDLSRVDFQKIKNYKIIDAVKSVSCKEITEYNKGGKYSVVLMDFGAKENIQRNLIKRGCRVTVVPYDTTAEKILSLKPDGIMLSNGPGDPAENVGIIAELKKLIKKDVPIFGICLGHQLLALANGFLTTKLKYGHRGANQPVKNLSNNRVYISSQNHGYAVVRESVNAAIADELFINVNDNTSEGLKYKNFNGFSVQFHPEAAGGPKDTEYLFDEFLKSILENKKYAVK